MADFQAVAALLNQQGDCLLVANDNSTYNDNTEQLTHARALFNWLHIEVVNVTTGEVFRLSSAAVGGAPDVVIDPPSVDSGDSWVIDPTFNDIAGDFTIKLFTVPNYVSREAYTTGDCVYDPIDGNLYVALSDSTSTPSPSSLPLLWQPITAVTLPPKYGTTFTFSQACSGISATVPFEATLRDSEGVEDITLTNCQTLSIVDRSNYADSDETGHELADFLNPRIVELTDPNGVKTVIPGMVAPNTGQMTITHTPETLIDGVYEVRICSFPTWNTDEYYISHSDSSPIYLYYADILYKSLQNNNGQQPDISSDHWTPVTDDELESYNGRYCYVGHLVVKCKTVNGCFEKSLNNAVCLISKDPCGKDICQDKDWIKVNELEILKEALCVAESNNDFDKVQTIIGYIKQLCCD